MKNFLFINKKFSKIIQYLCHNIDQNFTKYKMPILKHLLQVINIIINVLQKNPVPQLKEKQGKISLYNFFY